MDHSSVIDLRGEGDYAVDIFELFTLELSDERWEAERDAERLESIGRWPQV